MKKVMEMKTDKNLNKGGEETRKGGDRKGSGVKGINSHRSARQSGFLARSNISNFTIYLIHSLSITDVNLSQTSLKVTLIHVSRERTPICRNVKQHTRFNS